MYEPVIVEVQDDERKVNVDPMKFPIEVSVLLMSLSNTNTSLPLANDVPVGVDTE